MAINQAVILAGGLGKRLRPITNKIPKPLVDVCGKPFLQHIIEQLKNNKLKEIIILAGYKSNLIIDFVKKLKVSKIKIKVLDQPINFNTGARLLKALPLLNKNFLLLYGDNYCGIDIKKMIKRYNKQTNGVFLCIQYAFQKLLILEKMHLVKQNIQKMP